MKAHTRKQKVIAKGSAEAELHAAALGASEAKGVQSMMRDLVFAVKPVLNIDAEATEHILHWQGIGKLKHIDSDHRDCECTESGVKKMSKTWDEATQQSSDCEAVSHAGIREHECRACLE